MPKSKKSKTHFEQVSLETLKKLIVVEEIPNGEGAENDAIVEIPAKADP